MATLPRIPLRAVVAAFAALGAGLLVCAEFTPLLEVRAGQVVVERATTGTHHSYAQLVIALAALVMAWGGARAGAVPALVALLVLGALSGLITVLADLPDTRATGLTTEFEDAAAAPRAGLWLELAGGGLLVVAGLVGLAARASLRMPAAARSA